MESSKATGIWAINANVRGSTHIRNTVLTYCFSYRKLLRSSSSSSSDEEPKSREKKIDEVDRLAELERIRRQKEAEQKMVEEVAAKRLEELVNKRVEEELEKRKDEIEAEVLRRVEEAKRIMEQQMLEELQEKRRKQEEDQKKREVRNDPGSRRGYGE
ncbi:hypothetical protein Avbf_04379 [Armadillidium vulgare]|nr:hypothetical protein Avbf_04379 [Armadillidium vulgare]